MKLQKAGYVIAQRTVGKYMKEMEMKAQWIKSWTTATKDSDFSKRLKPDIWLSSPSFPTMVVDRCSLHFQIYRQ